MSCEGWLKCKLGDVAEFKTGKLNSHAAKNNGKYPFFTCSPQTLKIDTYAFNQSAILLAGNNAEGNFNIKFYSGKFNAYQRTYVIYPKNKKNVNIHYLYYYLKQQLDNFKRFSQGTSTKFLTTTILNDFVLPIPTFIEQKAIAATLSCLDDKIELNNRMNKTLEEMAQAIFKNWFVDFEPFQDGEFVDSELGQIPRGWKVVKLGDVTTQIHDRVKDNNLKVLSAIKTGQLTLSEEYFTKQVFSKNINNYIIVEPHVFAYNPARINIGSIGINDFIFKGCVSPVYVVFKTEPKYYQFFNMYIRTPDFKQEVITRASGSVRQTLNYSGFSLITIAYPPVEIVEKFNTIYDTFVNTIKKITAENDELTQIRDSLLPKLMSGEIRVPMEV